MSRGSYSWDRYLTAGKIREGSSTLLSSLSWELWVNESPDGTEPHLI